MLTEGAIGDTYGAGFEFADREVIRLHNRLETYIPHPKYASLHKRYTDDTQMALGIAELLLEGTNWNPKMIADKFVEVFQRDRRQGYSEKFYQLLDKVQNGQELLDGIHPQSRRNGAAMRAYPIGILGNESQIMKLARQQALITHHTDTGIRSSQAIALMLHYFRYDKGPQTQLHVYLADWQNYRWNNHWQGEVRVDGEDTVAAVLTLLESGNSLSEILKKSIDLGGDVDTVGSLTMAIGSGCKAIEKDLPLWMYKDLEDGTYGKTYLQKLDQQLRTLTLQL
ncbi:ADP-ribosylglycohydrolase family protein [Rapidithrix thailandica]|uniref:ADP-ribosylglycohydrolase family protein n=1 Tax=Rapidithrix thailandica TaxID=413964 RepID=A0AAW9S5X6_9BACT